MTHKHKWIAMTDCSARCIYIDDEHNYCVAELSKEEVDKRLRATECLDAEDAHAIYILLSDHNWHMAIKVEEYSQILKGD